MAATITASPVHPILTAGTTGKVMIKWDTGSIANGLVRVAVDAAAPVIFHDPGRASGQQAYTQLRLGSRYRFILHRKSDNQQLAEVTVATRDIVDAFVGWSLFGDKLDPPQIISNVTVVPGVDRVRIAFRTSLPTVPSVTVTKADGTQVAGWLPLFGGMRTAHECVLGDNVEFQQDTFHRFRIVAPGPRTALAKKPVDAVLNGAFTTGWRRATVFFDSIRVWNDGDPGWRGSGDFTIKLGAGDASTGGILVQDSDWNGNISDEDPPRSLNRAVTLSYAPRRIWVQAAAIDDDPDFVPGRPVLWGFAGGLDDASGELSGVNLDMAWVRRVFDLSDAAEGTTTQPMELPTGRHVVDFTLYGRLQVEAHHGTVVSLRRFRRSSSNTTVLGDRASRGVAGAYVAALGADRRVHLKPLESTAARDEGWTTVAGEVFGPVSVLAEGERLVLISTDAEGVLVVSEGEGWRNLGERPADPVAGGIDARGGVHLVLRREDGTVLHRELEGAEWTRVGDNASGYTQVLCDEEVVHVFAVGRDGEVLYRRRRDQAWIPEDGWQRLGRPGGTRLLAEPLASGGLGLVTLGDDGAVHNQVLGADEWTAVGTLEDLLDRR